MRYILITLLLNSFYSFSQTNTDVVLQNKKISIENLSQDPFEQCVTLSSESQLKIVKNINNDYSIKAPENWEVFENLIPETPGIILSSEYSGLLDMIGIVEIEMSNVDIEDYFKEELISTWLGSQEIKYIDAGKALIGERQSFWIQYVDTFELIEKRTYLYYIENNLNGKFYLINMSVAGPSVNIQERFCYLRKLLETFSIN